MVAPAVRATQPGSEK